MNEKKRLAYHIDTQSNNNPSSHAPKSIYHRLMHRLDDSDDKLSSLLLTQRRPLFAASLAATLTLETRNEAHRVTASKLLTDSHPLAYFNNANNYSVQLNPADESSLPVVHCSHHITFELSAKEIYPTMQCLYRMILYYKFSSLKTEHCCLFTDIL